MGGTYVWPTVEETTAYRRRVKELIHKVINRTSIQLPVKWDDPIVSLALLFFFLVRFYFIFHLNYKSGQLLWELNMKIFIMKHQVFLLDKSLLI
jgi:hypothetical protein